MHVQRRERNQEKNLENNGKYYYPELFAIMHTCYFFETYHCPMFYFNTNMQYTSTPYVLKQNVSTEMNHFSC